MTLLEHLEKRGEKRGKKRGQKRGRVHTLVRLMSAAIPEFSDSDASRLRGATNDTLDKLTDALAQRQPWNEIRAILRASTKP